MTFKKGQSGNPGGRPKSKGLMEIARSYTPDALKTLKDIMSDEKNKPAERIEAANAILDRGWGKPVQQQQVNAKVANVSSSELDAPVSEVTGWLTELLDDGEESTPPLAGEE